MNKRIAISILAFLSCAALCAGAAHKTLGANKTPAVHKTPAARQTSPAGPQVRDGFGLTGIDGKLSSTDGKWFFEFDSEVSDDMGQIGTGSIIELLPSTALEKITADAQKRAEANYRLWGNVTKYKGSNFIFPIYFLPVSPAEGQTKAEESSKVKIAINEPNDVLAIPEEIVGKLKTRRILRHEELKKGLQLKQDSILADRTALLDKQTDDEPVLVLDALGRNIPQVSLRLLPCEVLERAQQEQSAEADPVRFKIAGIITQYKGEYYLLLQKAIQAYSHENFGR